jgi:uncharacterized protein with HEPN domain
MTDRPTLAWLRESRGYALEAHDIARGLDEAAFDHSRRDQFAVRYCLAVVGEALSQLPKDVQALAPEIPWRAIYNLRNRLVHGYWLIDTRIVLRIAQDHTERLMESIDRLIEKIK